MFAIVSQALSTIGSFLPVSFPQIYPAPATRGLVVISMSTDNDAGMSYIEGVTGVRFVDTNVIIYDSAGDCFVIKVLLPDIASITIAETIRILARVNELCAAKMTATQQQNLRRVFVMSNSTETDVAKFLRIRGYSTVLVGSVSGKHWLT